MLDPVSSGTGGTGISNDVSVASKGAVSEVAASRLIRAAAARNRRPLRGCGGDRFADRQLEIELAHSNPVARIQEHFAAHALVVDKRTVGASQIPDVNGKIVNGKDAMMAADEFAVGT